MSANDEIQTKITATTDGFDAGIKRATAGVSDLNRGILSAVENAKKAAVEYEVIGKAAASSSEGMDKLSFATAGATREIIVLAHEVVQGRFSRIPGSLMVLGERMGGVSLATLGWAGAIAATGYGLYEMAAAIAKNETYMAAMQNRMEFVGRGFAYNSELIKSQVDKLNMLPGVSKDAAENMVALANSSNLTGKQIAFLIDHVELFAQGVGEDIPKAFNEFAAVIEHPLSKLRGLDDQTNILTATQRANLDVSIQEKDVNAARTIALDALNTRFSEMHDKETQLHKATKDFTTAWNDLTTAIGNSTGFSFIVDTVIPKLVEGLATATHYLQYIYTAKPGENFKQFTSQIEQAKKAAEAISKNPVLTDTKDMARQKQMDAKPKIDADSKIDTSDKDARDAQAEITEAMRIEEEKYRTRVEYIRMAAEQKKITVSEEYAELQAELAEEHNAQTQAYQQQLALWQEGSRDYQKIKNQMALADQKYELDKTKLSMDGYKQIEQLQQQSINKQVQMLRPLETAFNHMFSAIIRGQQSFRQIMLGLADSLLEKTVANLVHEQVMTWATENVKSAAVAAGESERLGIKSGAAAAGAAEQTMSAQSSIGKSAASAAASVYADVAAIPYVGWILAPPAAAAAFVAVEAFGSGMPSAAGGWEVPQDTLAMVHKDEKILPASVSKKIDNWTGDKGTGGDTHVHFNVSAIDGKSVKKFFANNSDLVAQSVGRVVRNNNRGVAMR